MVQGVVVFVEGDVFFRFEELAEEEFVGGGDEVEGDVFCLGRRLRRRSCPRLKRASVVSWTETQESYPRWFRPC